MRFWKGAVTNLIGAALFLLVVMPVVGVGIAVLHPDTSLPPEWNPTKPLRISDPVTPITHWKLARAQQNTELCIAVLSKADIGFTALPDLTESKDCHIQGRLSLRKVGNAELDPIETRCAIALRMAMWEYHGLRPAAQRILGKNLIGIEHYSSYSCRKIRTPDGAGVRMSRHATADAIDIRGFRFSDGQIVRLDTDWGTPTGSAKFLNAAHKTACDWFKTVLGPDYNSLHADHFHLQSKGWNLCR